VTAGFPHAALAEAGLRGALSATHESASNLDEAPTTSEKLIGRLSLAETQTCHNLILSNESREPS
jgi:hypothetical protein